jgi:hypothetical protein
MVNAPPPQNAFRTVALNTTDWDFLFTLPVAVVVAEEVHKFLSRLLSRKLLTRSSTITNQCLEDNS